MRKAIKTINYYAQFVGSFTMLALMLLTVAEVVMRSLFNAPIAGTYELTCVLLTFIVFFTFGHAHDYKEHVVIDLVYDHLPRVGRRFISFLSTLINLAIVALLCWVVFKYGLDLIAKQACTAILKIPHWPIVILAAVGMVGFVLSIISDLFFLIEGGVLSNDVD